VTNKFGNYIKQNIRKTEALKGRSLLGGSNIKNKQNDNMLPLQEGLSNPPLSKGGKEGS
jgi:hypothetical protein